LNNVGKKTVSVPIDFHGMDQAYYGSQYRSHSLSNIIQNILLTGLELHEGE